MRIQDETTIAIKCILNVRCREGATIADIENDYKREMGEPVQDVRSLLNSIESVYCDESFDEPKWFVKSDATQHIAKMILHQKVDDSIGRPRYSLSQRVANKNDCFFKDNYMYRNMRYKQYQSPRQEAVFNSPYKPAAKLPGSSSTQSGAHIDAQLVGDDFFRSLSGGSNEVYNRKNGIQQSGLCVSGLSIQAAAKLIEIASFKSDKLIINIGSVDILHDHDLIEMCSDFDKLMGACEKRRVKPIITTLAPLANSHSPKMCAKLQAFNLFLWDTYYPRYHVIDIWSQAIATPHGSTDFECYQTDSVYASGSNRPHVLWSHAGRNRICNYIQRSLNTILKKRFWDNAKFDG